MAYDKEEIYKRAIAAIEGDEDVVFMDDVICAVGIAPSTFYSLIPVASNESKHIKEALLNNSAKLKKGLRRNWKVEDASAALQVSLYKLLGTKEEREALNNDTNKGDSAPPTIKIENYIPLKPEHNGE